MRYPSPAQATIITGSVRLVIACGLFFLVGVILMIYDLLFPGAIVRVTT